MADKRQSKLLALRAERSRTRCTTNNAVLVVVRGVAAFTAAAFTAAAFTAAAADGAAGNFVVIAARSFILVV